MAFLPFDTSEWKVMSIVGSQIIVDKIKMGFKCSNIAQYAYHSTFMRPGLG